MNGDPLRRVSRFSRGSARAAVRRLNSGWRLGDAFSAFVGMQCLPHTEIKLDLEYGGVASRYIRQLNAERVVALGLDGAAPSSQEAREVAGERRIAHSDVQSRRRFSGVAATESLHSLCRDSRVRQECFRREQPSDD